MEVTVKATKMTKKSISFIVFAGLSLLTLAAFVKTVFVSIDIDESYAVTQAFRLTKGDRLLRDMWEPHQFSAYLSSLFVSLYLFLFQSTEGIVVFLRLCGTVLHLLLGAALYRTFRGLASAHISLPLCLLHLNFLAKWIQTPEFELMHYWLLTVTLIAFLRFYLNGGKRRWLFLSGLCMTLQLFNYPTLILLYPFYIAGILALPGIRKKKLQNIGIVTLGAAFPGISLLLYLLSYMTPESLIANLSYVLADPSHTGNGLVPRLGAFGLEFLKDLLLLAVLFLLCLLSVYLLRKIPPHKNTPQFRLMFIRAGTAEIILLCSFQILGCLFFDQNQFFLQNRYLFAALLGLSLYLSEKEHSLKKKLLFWFAMVPGILSTLAAVLLTNMSMNVSYSKLFLCVPALFLYLADEAPEYEAKGRGYMLSLLSLICSLLVCRLILIRVTGCLPVTVNAAMTPMEQGPLKGIYVTDRLHIALTANHLLLAEYVSEEDRMFYFGCESLLYLTSQADISAASVQGTAVFNQDFLDYLELHPEKYPSVIAVDKTFPMIDAYRYDPYNYIVADWISQVCEDAEKVETDHMTLYFLP